MKKQINEIKRMQLIAGLITESEYRELLNTAEGAESDSIANILRSWDAEESDKEDYKTVAYMIENNEIEEAISFIENLDTSVKEMIMGIIEENSPELYKKMFNAEPNADKFQKSKTLDVTAAAFRVKNGEDYDELANEFPNLKDPNFKDKVMKRNR